MGLSFRIDETQRCIFTTLQGVLDNWSLGVGAQALLADPRFDKHFVRLIDATQVSSTDALHGDLLQSVAQDFSDGTRIALVGGPAVQPILRLYQSHLQNMECRLFEDREAALAWLGVTDHGPHKQSD